MGVFLFYLQCFSYEEKNGYKGMARARLENG